MAGDRSAMNAYLNSLDRGIANGITSNGDISHSLSSRKYFVRIFPSRLECRRFSPIPRVILVLRR